MWVVKLGGSLGQDASLKRWLWNLAEYGGGRVVIVPGGGRLADQVRVLQRHWKIDDRIAHRMAILAMHQYGLLFLGLEPRLELSRTEEIRGVLNRGRVAVWLPEVTELDRDGVPASWDVTSDSLAAWLAGKLHAERLVLVKSLPLSCGQAGKVPTDPSPILLRETGIVDTAFPDWLPAAVELDCYHRDEFERFSRKLRVATLRSQ